jgi:hypothetical protein
MSRAVGIGLGTILLLGLAGWALGINPMWAQVRSSLHGSQAPTSSALGAASDRMGEFVSAVLGSTEVPRKAISALEIAQLSTVPRRGAEKGSPQAFAMEEFLNRLMAAESGGSLYAKNPRSTALGPFQFIESTFLFVVNKHFSDEVGGLTEPQVLARRTEMDFSRRAARAYTKDLISVLKDNNLPATTLNVRIAFLIGPSAAVRLLKAPLHQPLRAVLSDDAITANPFMSGSTIAQLIQKAAADMRATGSVIAGPGLAAPTAEIVKHCRQQALEAHPTQRAATKPATGSVIAGPGLAAPTAEIAKHCRQQALEAHPTQRAGAKQGQAQAQRDYFRDCVAKMQCERNRNAGRNASAKRASVDTPGGLEGKPEVAKPAQPGFTINCHVTLASCRRWIVLEERRRARLLRSAQR